MYVPWFLAGRGVSPLAHTGGVTHRFFIARFPRVDARSAWRPARGLARSASRRRYLRPFRVSRHYLLITLFIYIDGALCREPRPFYDARILNPQAPHHHFHHHHRVGAWAVASRPKHSPLQTEVLRVRRCSAERARRCWPDWCPCCRWSVPRRRTPASAAPCGAAPGDLRWSRASKRSRPSCSAELPVNRWLQGLLTRCQLTRRSRRPGRRYTLV